jgi:hypothetical protein
VAERFPETPVSILRGILHEMLLIREAEGTSRVYATVARHILAHWYERLEEALALLET